MQYDAQHQEVERKRNDVRKDYGKVVWRDRLRVENVEARIGIERPVQELQRDIRRDEDGDGKEQRFTYLPPLQGVLLAGDAIIVEPCSLAPVEDRKSVV